MEQVTFREDEAPLELIDDITNHDIFANRSEFYRFARDYTLNSIVDNYNPTTDNFNNKLSQLEDPESLDDSLDISEIDENTLDPGLEYLLTERIILYDERIEDSEKLEKLSRLNNMKINEYESGTYLELLRE